MDESQPADPNLLAKPDAGNVFGDDFEGTEQGSK
jgi:hypothetical protein